MKLILQPSNLDEVIIKSQKLLQSQKRTGVIKLGKSKKIDYIFIIGLPRSGSTLLESILSMNTKTFPLGETNLLEESYKEWKNSSNLKQLNHYYDLGKAKFRKGKYISIDKNLFNFRYLDLIATKFPNAFVIHTYRHPLDNLLSIYRAKFKSAHINYSSSLVDTTKMIMDTEKVIAEYDNIIGNKIYHLNYDLLVNSPEIIIRDLIKSLNLEWKNNYLSPHSNTRPVSTASKISVRSPINNKSVGIWKEYEKMLRPAIKIFESDKVFSRIIKSSLK